jgi:hypothetical protein
LLLFQLFGIEINNPRYAQGLKDLTLDILGVAQPALPAITENWLGVAERAEQLGYKPCVVVNHRSTLGRWVSKQKLVSRKESRLCNGTERAINLYLESDALDFAIHAYFAGKGV